MNNNLSDVKNVSAQLYDNQLPPDTNAAYYGCKNDFNTDHLTTCVDYPETDKNIENAFQKQLNLSEYYKSPYVFETIKNDFMDQTMEGMNKSSGTRFIHPVKRGKSVRPIVPVGPRDFMGNIKESFGVSTSMINWVFIIFIIVCLFLFYKMVKGN